MVVLHKPERIAWRYIYKEEAAVGQGGTALQTARVPAAPVAHLAGRIFTHHAAREHFQMVRTRLGLLAAFSASFARADACA